MLWLHWLISDHTKRFISWCRNSIIVFLTFLYCWHFQQSVPPALCLYRSQYNSRSQYDPVDAGQRGFLFFWIRILYPVILNNTTRTDYAIKLNLSLSKRRTLGETFHELVLRRTQCIECWMFHIYVIYNGEWYGVTCPKLTVRGTKKDKTQNCTDCILGKFGNKWSDFPADKIHYLVMFIYS